MRTAMSVFEAVEREPLFRASGTCRRRAVREAGFMAGFAAAFVVVISGTLLLMIAGPLTSGQLAAAFVLAGAAVGLVRLGRHRVTPGARHHET